MGRRAIDPRLQELYDHKIKVYSYSKLSTYCHCMFDYFQAYIMKVRSPDNIYSKVGSVSHDGVEEYYKDEVENLEKAKQDLLKTIGDSEMMGVGFPEDPPTIKNNYIKNMTHFFDTHQRMKESVNNGDMLTELFVLYKTPKGHHLQMYIDVITVRYETETELVKDLFKLTPKQKENYEKHLAGETVPAKTLSKLLEKVEAQPDIVKEVLDCNGQPIYKLDEKGNYIPIFTILDWKTSSKFGGEKKVEAGRQLLLYKIGVEQMTGQKVEKLAWNMLKYVNVRYTLKSGKVEKSLQERRSWVSFLEKRIMDELIEMGQPDIVAGSMVMNAIQSNSLEGLPKEITDKYWFEDAILEYEFTDELLEATVKWVDDTIDEIESKEPLEVNFPACEISEKNNFFCGQLCRKGKCPYYVNFLKAQDGKFEAKKPVVKDRFNDLFGGDVPTPPIPTPPTPPTETKPERGTRRDTVKIEDAIAEIVDISKMDFTNPPKVETPKPPTNAIDMSFFNVAATKVEPTKEETTTFLDDFFSK